MSLQYNCLEHTSRPHDPIERSSAPMGPKCVQLCKESAYSEVFITNFHAVAGHVWLAERGPRGGRDLAFEGRSRGKASSRACRAMLTPTTTLTGPNRSCLTMYTCKVWSESISKEAFHRLCPNTAEQRCRRCPSARPSSCHPGEETTTEITYKVNLSLVRHQSVSSTTQ